MPVIHKIDRNTIGKIELDVFKNQKSDLTPKTTIDALLLLFTIFLTDSRLITSKKSQKHDFYLVLCPDFSVYDIVM